MNSNRDSTQKILGVVVTYFPDSSLESRIQKLIEQFEEVLIVDNTPCEESQVSLQLLMKFSNLSILRMKKNMGIAYALNEGLNYAKNHGYSWIGTFDQDSTLPDNFLQEIFSGLKNFPQKDKVAILSPVYLLPDGSKKSFSYKRKNLTDIRVVDFTMTSGNVVNVAKAEQAGGYDNYLFIDYVDFDLCLRFRIKGFLILENAKIILAHDLGKNFSHKRFLFKMVGITNYPPSRVYFSTRNRLILYTRFWKTAPEFVMKDISKLPMVIIKILLFESEKKSKIQAFFVGFRDGIFRRLEINKNG